jgi:hypothetical protein
MGLLLAGCVSHRDSEQSARRKIAFDLNALGAEGLAGPPDGLRSVDYEFCIPAEESKLAEIREIDPSIRVMRGSRGRIGCGPEQWLCLGNTHQPGWRQILLDLAVLPYVERIEQTFWE